MAEIPPSGPPPPRVPEGWKAVWNAQYSEWFYVNTHTRESSWIKPTAPAPDPTHAAPDAPPGPPPAYDPSAKAPPAEKLNPNNPYNQTSSAAAATTTSSSRTTTDTESDAQLAARLQAEEDARARTAGTASRGSGAPFFDQSANYSGAAAPPLSSGGGGGGGFAQELPPREAKSKGVMGKLFDKLGGHSSHQGPAPYGQPGYGGPPPQGYGGPPPPQGYGYGPPAGYGYGGHPPPPAGYGYGSGPPMPPQQGYGYAPQPGYGYAGPPQQYGQPVQQPDKAHGMGMGVLGGAALGVGGGLVGGMLLEDAIQDHDQSEYQQGYDQGQDNANYGDGGMQGDYGGGDDMGGDF